MFRRHWLVMAFLVTLALYWFVLWVPLVLHLRAFLTIDGAVVDGPDGGQIRLTRRALDMRRSCALPWFPCSPRLVPRSSSLKRGIRCCLPATPRHFALAWMAALGGGVRPGPRRHGHCNHRCHGGEKHIVCNILFNIRIFYSTNNILLNISTLSSS